MKLGCYFMDAFMIIKCIGKRYTINYADVKKITYIKWTLRNYVLSIYNHDLTPGFLHVYFENNSKKRLKHRTGFFRYDDLDKIPKNWQKKLEIIEKITLF